MRSCPGRWDWILVGALVLLAAGTIAAAWWSVPQPATVEVVQARYTTTIAAKTHLKIDLNTADADALTQLEGIGPTLAQRIVDYRTENGPFQSVEELLLVQGIGEGRLAAIRDSLWIS